MGAPWSVKGIDPKAREVAKELARRSGMTLGEWLNRVILEDDVPEEVTSEAHFGARPRAVFETPKHFTSGLPSLVRPDDLGRIAFALDRLTDRIEASETRTGLAISGVEHSVRHAVARIESAERETMAYAARHDAAAERLELEQSRLAERLRRAEAEPTGPRSAEALKALEQSVTRVASHLYEGETRNRETMTGLEARIARAEAAAGGDPDVMIEEVVQRLGQRLADAESRTGEALDSLRTSLAELDRRMSGGDRGGSDLDQRFEALARELTGRVEDARSEMAERLAASGPGEVQTRLAEMAGRLNAAEQRSAHAIEAMGREVLNMAETLNRRVQSAEQRSAEAIEQVGGEIARIAAAVESRLGRVDQLHAEALERLGAEIGRITERLTDRIIQSERRAAQAIDDVGEQVAKVTERIEQRHERASSDLAERIRQSEERTRRFLEQARQGLSPAAIPAEAQLADPTGLMHIAEARRDFEPEPEPEPETERQTPDVLFGPELFSRAEPMHHPALDPAHPTFAEEDFAAADRFAPLDEIEDNVSRGADDTAVSGASEDTPAPAAAQADAETAPLSTREVIEQARAAARAAAGVQRPPSIQASERRGRHSRGGLFGALKPTRPTSTWQTALMVAGGAAFLSVGAAGVVLLEGPSRPDSPLAPIFESAPRAAVALASKSTSEAGAPPNPTSAEPAAVGSPQAAPLDALSTAFASALQGVAKREPGALARLKAIAEAGHTPAQFALAQLYADGKGGVKQNLPEARKWTVRAAEADDPAAMHNLALYYFRGEGGPPDSAAAASWFRKAAQRGVVDSQYNLGQLYQAGSGVPRDLGEAYKWFSIAAIGGDGASRAAAMELEDKLSTAQLAAAESAAAHFQPASETAAQGSIPKVASLDSGPALAKAQKVLGRLGYYKGSADGSMSRDLKVAVSHYQSDQGLPATGSLDPATASRLSVFTR
jgi:localization factor PodJL